jgi:hypothetical protein
MSEVADLLANSRAAHQAALPGSKKSGRPRLWKDSLRLARELRVQAHAIDPTHSDPAWQAEQDVTPRGYDTHEMLLDFYEDKLR